MGYESMYSKSYAFVPYGKRMSYNPSGEKMYSGYIDIRIECLTDLYIGSGYRDFKGTGNYLVNETIRSGGRLIIPGSSLKGAVRGIARAVSNSCIPLKNEIKCKPDNYCIVCDIFGMMGKGSKVIFPDFRAEDNAKTAVKDLNAQFGPKVGKDGSRDGYKFYATGENDYKATSVVKTEVICKGSAFSGRIHFSNMTREEMALLSYALTLNEDENQLISMKAGGFKNEGMGELKITVKDCVLSGGRKPDFSLPELATGYYDMKTANQDGIEVLEGILERK